MKKLAYLLALPIALGLVYVLATEVVYASVKTPDRSVTAFSQDKPFIERVKTKEASGYTYEKITINSPGKPVMTGIGYSGKTEVKPAKLWFYINDKLYNENEAQRFDGAFVKGLSNTKGFSFARDYDLPGIEKNFLDVVFWFGKEPKLSDFTAKNRAIYKKYNGTTVTGTVVEYTYSPISKTLMDGFIIKTDDGVLLKAFVEAKFVKQANAMIAKGEQVTIKIYNAAYWKDNAYPVLSSFKLMKGDKVLFDRWPKTANNVAKPDQSKIGTGIKANAVKGSATGPLMVLDYKMVEGDLSSISADRIESIHLLKSSPAKALYGEKGKNGAFVVYSKKTNDKKEPSSGMEPLIILDQKIIEDDLSSMSTDRIESIHVLNSPSATALYGDKGKNGAFVIYSNKENAKQEK